MPIFERWVLDDLLQMQDDYNFENTFNSSGNVIASMFSLQGFDDSAFDISIPTPGSGFGEFPSPEGARPSAVPFPGWNRWTNSSRVVKLGMLWTFPVLDRGENASIHLSAAPDLLWRYIDLYNFHDYSSEVTNIKFYFYEAVIGNSTLQLMNNISRSRVLTALSDMQPITFTVTTPVSTSVSVSELLNMKLAWLNMSDNTWNVLCNTTVVAQQCGTTFKLTATVQINASLFFDYTRQNAQDIKAGAPWSAPLDSAENIVSNYRTLGFDSNFSDLGFAPGILQQQACAACDSQLRAAEGPCNGCGGRFELFTFAGCYCVPSLLSAGMTHPAPWTVRSSFSVAGALSGRMVSGCDTRVVPRGVPSENTAGCDGSPQGFQSTVVLQPGLGFRAIIEAGTFDITVGLSMCVTPYNPALKSTGYVPDLVNIQVSQTPLCSDIARFYLDANPTKSIIIVVPIMLKYIQLPYVTSPPSTDPSTAKNGMAVAWYSVRENRYYPMCTNFPITDNSIWVNFPVSTLRNPDFSNGPAGCPDIFSTLASTRQKRCDGFGARITCLIDNVCDGYSPPCTTQGTCFAGTTGEVRTTNGTVVVSGSLPPLVAIWEDQFIDVQSDTWDPEITLRWNPALLLTQNISAKLPVTMLGLVVRIYFSTTPQEPLTVAVDVGQRLLLNQTSVVKLAWFNRSSGALDWTPICNSSATTDGIVTATLDPELLESPDFYNNSFGLNCSASETGIVTPTNPGVPIRADSCHFAALLVTVVIPSQLCSPNYEPCPGGFWSSGGLKSSRERESVAEGKGSVKGAFLTSF